MAKIKTLLERKEPFYPQTVGQAVIMSSGKTIEQALESGSISTSQLADGAVTDEKIATSLPRIHSGTTAPSASLGRDGDIYFQYEV